MTTKHTRSEMTLMMLWAALLWMCIYIGVLIGITVICSGQSSSLDIKPIIPKYRGGDDDISNKLSRIEQWTELHSIDQDALKTMAKDSRTLIDINSNRLTKLETQYISMCDTISTFTWWFRAVALMIGTQLLVGAYEFAKSIIDRSKK